MRANAAVALRRAATSLNRTAQLGDVKLLLSDADLEVRLVAMKWVGEKGFTELGREVDAAAKRQPASVRLFRAALETEQLLARADPAHPDHGKSGMTFKATLSAGVLERTAFDASAPVEFRIFALAMMPVDALRPHAAKLAEWAVTDGSPLQGAAVWSLGFAGGHEAAQALDPRDQMRGEG